MTKQTSIKNRIIFVMIFLALIASAYSTVSLASDIVSDYWYGNVMKKLSINFKKVCMILYLIKYKNKINTINNIMYRTLQ